MYKSFIYSFISIWHDYDGEEEEEIWRGCGYCSDIGGHILINIRYIISYNKITPHTTPHTPIISQPSLAHIFMH